MKELENKKTLNLKRLMMAVAMTACVVSHAFAATPRKESVIMHDQVTLGDVFDGVRSNADYVLAPAPEAGGSLILNAADLTRISEAFHLGWTSDGSRQQAVIRRSSSEVGANDIRTALQEKLAAALNGQNLETELSDPSISFRVADGGDTTLEVENLTYDITKGEFKASVFTAAAPDLKKEVKGKFYSLLQLPVLKAPLRPGDVISAADIDYINVRAANVSASTIVDAKKLTGLTPRRGLSAMKPLMAADVQMPVIIKKGDLVTMMLKSDILNLTAQGRAMDNGAEGDVVRVMNTSSKQVVEGVITGPQAVSIKPASNTL
jgi:flagella basal body P-ring formation protein FlgA